MSDYMFMLDNHLSAEQSRMVAEVQAAAANANVNVFLTGGALRDMLGGFPLREIDFTVEGNPLKLAKILENKNGAKIVSSDEHLKLARLEFPGEVPTTIGMARHERHAKPGAKAQVHAATIHEDLRGRDFTVNAIALSLSRGSRGLLIDPTNGAGDLERKELRATSNYTLYDDPSRILRLQRLKVRLAFAIEERTKMQYDNAREAALETRITPDQLRAELTEIAEEPDPGEVLRVFQEEKLLGLFSEALAGKLNLHSFEKLHKLRQSIPFGVHFPLAMFGLFLYLLTERLTPKERLALIKHLGLKKAHVTAWQTLEARAKKLEREMKSPKLNKPSKVYIAASLAPGDQVLFLLMKSTQRLVQDRLKNYLQKYLPMAQEITGREVIAAGGQPGTAKGEKLREQLILKHLDARPKKVEPEPVVETPVVVATGPGKAHLEMADLSGKIALITGASKGLGKSIALALGAAGAAVALVSRDEEKLREVQDEIASAGGNARVFVADVAREESVKKLKADVSRQLGNVQILVNNAGINIRKNLIDFTLEEWRSVMDTNLTSVFLMCRGFAPGMKGRGYGRILNMTSIMSHVSLPGRSAYSASKTALLGLIRALALELAADGITVNGISPGPFATDMNLAVMNNPEANAQFLSSLPVGRWGEAQEIGSLALYLCSEAAGFITGTDIVIDGGWCAR